MTVSIKILKAGPQTTIQAKPRKGTRHLGIPWSGAADPLSHALANRLVGNERFAPCLEISLGPFEAEIPAEISFALTGAPAPAMLRHRAVPFHATIRTSAPSILKVRPPKRGARLYLAFAGSLRAEAFLGSHSTYLPARFGGHEGRTLSPGDALEIDPLSTPLETVSTPQTLRPTFSNSWALRATPGPDSNAQSGQALFGSRFVATNRADRTGIELDGVFPTLDASQSVRPSSGVWPGTLQLPKSGKGFLLLSDAQTTGGYPHILQVNRTDRHLMGQIRPKDGLQFLKRTPEQAAMELRAKTRMLQTWLPGFEL